MVKFLTPPSGLGWRVPNRVFVALSLVVVALTWTMLIIAYPLLPAVIPSHFGFSGAADATTLKTWWRVFLPAMLQAVLVILMWWLSRHPEYSNLPTGLVIRLLPEPTQQLVKRLLAHLLVMTGLMVSLIMAYLSLGIVRVGLGDANLLNSWAIFGLVGLLLLTIGVYTGWLVTVTRPHQASESDQTVTDPRRGGR